MTEPLVIRDLGDVEYHADTTTLSASGAKVLLGKRPPAPDGEALRFGTLVHIALLEPHRLEHEYAALNPSEVGLNKDGSKSANPLNTTAWKTAVAEAEESGKTVISQADLDRAQAMAAAVLEHATARQIIEMATDHELSAYADHPTGARVRGRFDLAGPIMADLKTGRDADPHRFGRTAHDFGYHISAANYLDIAQACGLDPQGFAWINVEKEPTPGGIHRVSVTHLPEHAIDLGRRLMAEGCERWLALGKQIDLPSYGDGFTTVDLPPWAYSEDPTIQEAAA